MEQGSTLGCISTSRNDRIGEGPTLECTSRNRNDHISEAAWSKALRWRTRLLRLLFWQGTMFDSANGYFLSAKAAPGTQRRSKGPVPMPYREHGGRFSHGISEVHIHLAPFCCIATYLSPALEEGMCPWHDCACGLALSYRRHVICTMGKVESPLPCYAFYVGQHHSCDRNATPTSRLLLIGTGYDDKPILSPLMAQRRA